MEILHSCHAFVYISISRVTELPRSAPIAKSSSDQQPFVHHVEMRRPAASSGATTADMSEGSTNTEDYVTCTDALKRGIMATSSTTHKPGSNLTDVGIDVVLSCLSVLSSTYFIYTFIQHSHRTFFLSFIVVLRNVKLEAR